MLIRCN